MNSPKPSPAPLTVSNRRENPASFPGDPSAHDVVWHRPSVDVTGQMPFGNGDMAGTVCVLEGGDLFILLGKNDTYTYQGDLFKTGRVRVSLSPNPFEKGKSFRQTLNLATGSIEISADEVRIRIWMDAHRNTCHVEVHAPQAIHLRATPDLWTRFDHCAYNVCDTFGHTATGIRYLDHTEKTGEEDPGPDPTQDVLLERDGHLLWYFAVGDRSVYPEDLQFYRVPEMADRFADPYRFNTFGNLMESPDLVLSRGGLGGRGTRFDLRIHGLTLKAPEAEAWIQAIQTEAARPVKVETDWKNHVSWWRAFWNRGWIMATDRSVPEADRGRLVGECQETGVRSEPDGAAVVTQSYTVFRFLMACQSRGRVPVKFNGGLFTQPLRVDGDKGFQRLKRTGAARRPDGTWITHEDDRLWGRRFTFQNQRLLYWPLLMSGDVDLMKPFFDYYADMLPMRKAITRAWFGHGGAYFRENLEPTGGERDCEHGGIPPKTKPGEQYSGFYHDYYFTSGLETVAMMLDRYEYTSDRTFAENTLVPFAREVLEFFRVHWPRVDGKIRLDPAQVVETFWIAVNPAPDIAGLHFCLDRLMALDLGSAADRNLWADFKKEIPEVPLREVDGNKMLAPAERYEKNMNEENGELYPVFPFRLFGLAQGTRELVENTMAHRTRVDAFGCACWTQDQIFWALSGHAREAARGLEARFRIASTMCRFPLYGREVPDSCPDLDHFGSGAIALQRMLVQEHGGKIHLVPAWPADWDVDFKVHLTEGGTLSGKIAEGQLVSWEIEPATRRDQVVVHALQKADPPSTPSYKS